MTEEYSLWRFCGIMLSTLQENNYKEHWSFFSTKRMRNRLRQELTELDTAMRNKRSPDEVDREAADVANFAMMVAENYRTETGEKKEDK